MSEVCKNKPVLIWKIRRGRTLEEIIIQNILHRFMFAGSGACRCFIIWEPLYRADPQALSTDKLCFCLRLNVKAVQSAISGVSVRRKSKPSSVIFATYCDLNKLSSIKFSDI
jgi:hypothetical protein